MCCCLVHLSAENPGSQAFYLAVGEKKEEGRKYLLSKTIEIFLFQAFYLSSGDRHNILGFL